MKKFFLIAFATILLTNITFSQQAFKTFLPKDGLPTAINHAKTQGINNPILIFLVTTSQKFEGMPPMFQPTVELNSGKASLWMYQLRDKEIDTLTTMVLITKVSLLGFDQYMPIALPVDPGDFLPELVKPIEGNWLQSDSAFASIRRDQVYKEFAKNNPNHFVLFSVLGINDQTPEYDPNTPYWYTLISADTTESSMEFPMTCITNAITNETVCIHFNSVSDNSDKITVFPNPSDGKIFVKLDKQYSYPLSISIINLNGIEVKNYTIDYSGSPIPLKITDLPPGEYLIWIHNQEINALTKIIKQ